MAKILIADDYDDNRELLRLMLEGAGHTVREAKDGGECLTLARTELPDLLLVDLSMPVFDGWKVLHEIRNDERTRGIPCVAVTAFSEIDPGQPVRDGFDGYLSKPFKSKDLLSTVGEVLGQRAASRVV